MAAAKTFRTGQIDTRDLAREDRSEAWRRLGAPLFEVSGLPADVLARGKLIQMGAVAFTDSQHPEQVFERDAARIRRDGADAVFCSIELGPGTQIIADGRLVGGGVGEVILTDLARPSAKIGAAGRTLCVAIERDALREHVPDPALIMGRVNGVWGGLLADYLKLIRRSEARVDVVLAAEMEQAVLGLLSGCAGAPDARERSRAAIEQLLRRRATILMDQHLQDPDLSPERLAQLLAVSRATLYRAFAEGEGVGTALRGRRLLRARRLLSLPIPIREVAYRVGFRSEAHFSTAFRRRFGLTPSEARRMAPSPVPAPTPRG